MNQTLTRKMPNVDEIVTFDSDDTIGAIDAFTFLPLQNRNYRVVGNVIRKRAFSATVYDFTHDALYTIKTDTPFWVVP